LSTVSHAKAARTPGGAFAALLSLRGVVLFWAVYGIAHAGLRLSVSRTLTIDDARANELSQTLSLGYQVRQPPLYEWILWSVQQVLGPGIESHLLVRYSLIALIGIATFGAVRAAVKDERWAAAASFSLVLAYPVSWTFHEWATQTLLLCIGCLVTFHAAIRFLEQPALRSAVVLGLALALGFYAKFSFPLFLGGLALAALSLRETRDRLADRRLLAAVLIPAVALLPYAFWVVQVQGNVVADVSAHLVKGEQSHLVRTAYGLWRLAVSIPTFLLPWIAFVALLAPAVLMRAPADAPPASIAERLAWRTMLFATLLAAIGIVATGATNVAARYMHPILIIAPVFMFARLGRLIPGEERIGRYVAVALIAAPIIIAIRFVGVTDNPLTERAGRALLIPYEELAEELDARGVTGTVASVNVREAGNLRAFLPELRVIGGDSLRVAPPPAAVQKDCALIWTAGQETKARALAKFDAVAVERIAVERQSDGILASRAGTWFFVRLEPGSAVCR
jgi:hypothetical protein